MIGDEILRRRVASRCGDPDDVFTRYGHRFGRWLDTEPAVRADREVDEVRAAVAHYLGDAVREGRRWGAVIGLAVGLAGGLGAFLLIWAIA